jgi:hypothetical protein
VYQQVATRRYADEETGWELMRFADERAERRPTRQVTRGTESAPGGIGASWSSGAYLGPDELGEADDDPASD